MKKRIIYIALFMISPTLLVYALYSFTYQPNKENNSFLRNISYKEITPLDTAEGVVSYGYICGVTDYHIFIEDPNNPRRLVEADWALKNIHSYTFKLPNSEKVLSRVTYQVDSPFVHIFAGNEPSIFSATWNDGLTVRESKYPYPLYMRAIALSSKDFVFKGFDTTGTQTVQTFAVWDNDTRTQRHQLNPFGHSKDLGINDDGLMDYDSSTQKIIYVPFYKNGFLVLDTNLSAYTRTKTIDTAIYGRTSGGSYKENGQLMYTNNAPQFIVNSEECINQGKVFINSMLRADNETKSGFASYDAVDVYSILYKKYLYSFHVPKYHKQDLVSFRVYDNRIAVIYPNSIVTYHIP
jgi:hypothetical protein